MKTKPATLLSTVVMFVSLGSQIPAQEAEAHSESKVTIEVNGKKIVTDGTGGTITIRTDGDAIEIDTDGDGKPEEQIQKPGASEKMGWLGIKTIELSAELASQLELDGGAVIEMVLPDSPAEKSGLQDYDIITAVGETVIGSPEDLSSTIRAMAPGSTVGISVIRKAKRVELVATLGDRPEMPDQEELGAHGFDLDLEGDAEEIRERIEKIQKEMLKGMKLRLDGADLPDLNNGADIVRMSSKTTSFSDGDGSITITTKDGETQIEAKDADGKLLYKGPAETEDDRKKLPPEVLEKLERFEAMDVDIDIEGFEDKLLPPELELPELEPAKPKKPTS